MDKNKWLSFEEAREFVKLLKLKKREEWLEYCKSGNKPDDIPVNPRQTYKNKDWNGWDDFLGNRHYKSYDEAKEFVHLLDLKIEEDLEKLELSQLKMLLNNAVDNEDYEAAAKIRDIINARVNKIDRNML
jgi:hypothetical protein